jgi:hypothetical protein
MSENESSSSESTAPAPEPSSSPSPSSQPGKVYYRAADILKEGAAAEPEQKDDLRGLADPDEIPPEERLSKIGQERADENERRAEAQALLREIAPPVELSVRVPMSQAHEAVARELAEDFTAIAKDANIPVDELQPLFDFAISDALEYISKDEQGALSQGQVPGPDLASRQQCENYIRRRYGKEADGVLAHARQAFMKLPMDVRAFLDSGPEPLTNHPSVIAALWMWNAGFSKLNPKQAKAELARVLSDKNQDNVSRDRARFLRILASADSKRDLSIKSRAQKQREADKAMRSGLQSTQIEKRIAELRTHPAYLDKSHASHKEVVQQVSDLYAQRRGGG